ncbi:MAG: type II toxin-antitoxin system HicB family antitoxin [Bacteroidales bacterium]|jgi:predicted HicB family RNase H-like nuclease|nr:type II toxin-antitoxin system HicB family antitoxin [Bacteroidales bacterium]
MKKSKQDSNYLTYKGYTGSIEFSLMDKCLFGKILGFEKGVISYEGQTLEELEKDFKAGVDDYLLYCRENSIEPKKPFTGLFSVRLDPELHRRLYFEAQGKGITINKFVKQAIEHELHESK